MSLITLPWDTTIFSDSNAEEIAEMLWHRQQSAMRTQEMYYGEALGYVVAKADPNLYAHLLDEHGDVFLFGETRCNPVWQTIVQWYKSPKNRRNCK